MDDVVFSFAAIDSGPPKEQGLLESAIDNVFGKWRMRIGDTMTGGEMRAEAKSRGVFLDVVGFDQLAKISTLWYRSEAIGYKLL